MFYYQTLKYTICTISTIINNLGRLFDLDYNTGSYEIVLFWGPLLYHTVYTAGCGTDEEPCNGCSTVPVDWQATRGTEPARQLSQT